MMVQKGRKTMKLRMLVLVFVSGLLLMSSTGCDDAWEDGLRDGLETGLANALASIIEAPVEHVLDQQFGDE